jgi:hypothetical protein
MMNTVMVTDMGVLRKKKLMLPEISSPELTILTH